MLQLKAVNSSVVEKYEIAAQEAADYLVSQVGLDGYISAAKDYKWYKPHWFRDSSWVAISLLRYAAYLKGKGEEYSKYLDAANRIIEFNLEALEKYVPNLERGLHIGLDGDEFFKLRNHIPARVARSKNLYVDENINDFQQYDVARSGLIQYDTVPLILASLYFKDRFFGLNPNEISFMKERGRLVAEYLGKIFGTECASVWEIESNLLHAYDVGIIGFAFRTLEYFSEKYNLGITKQELEKIESTLYGGNPLEFLRRYFVKDGILYRAKRSFENSPVVELGVGASAIFIFLLGVRGEDLGDAEIEARTIRKIEADLFNGNVLPIRFNGDTYFKGGRWLLLGLSFAEYYANNGEIEKARSILDYVIDKYKGSYPEQEIVNPASPTTYDRWIEENGGRPIQDLAWSYAALITASLAFISATQEKIKKAKRD